MAVLKFFNYRFSISIFFFIELSFHRKKNNFGKYSMSVKYVCQGVKRILNAGNIRNSETGDHYCFSSVAQEGEELLKC